MEIDAVIFDMDGLILDTEKLYQRFWREAARECGYEMSQQTALELRSLDKTLARRLLCGTFGEGFDYDLVKRTRIRLMNDYVDKNGVEAKSGVRELTEALAEKGIRYAIATATNYERASDHLTRAGVRGCFDTIVCACDLPHGKPYPDVYLYACEKLGASPEKCIALEDSPNGIRSAKAAGLRVIHIPDSGAPEPEADMWAESLNDVIGLISLNKKEKTNSFHFSVLTLSIVSVTIYSGGI